VSIRVEESPEFVLELWEFLFTWVSLIPFDIVIQNMDGFRFEKFTKLCILMNHISDPHLFNIGVNTLISESGVEHSQWEKGKDFEAS
jgi:hypothetical protein